MDRAQSKLFVASQRINDLTGYSGIEMLKEQVAGLETSLAEAQEALHTARAAYKTKVAGRASTQREVTTLLARQKTWTPLDFERFTTLYRTDYELEAEVAERARDLEEAERDAERLARELSTAILARYHEEQIWSDKIRRMSTWGTWGLMGVNVLLFLVFQFGAEPWRRARLVRGFEHKVREAMDADRAQEQTARDTAWREFMDYVAAKVPQAAVAVAAAVPTPAAETSDAAAAEPKVEVPDTAPGSPLAFPSPLVPSSWRDALVDPAWWQDAAAYLASEQQVAIRMRDVSLIALEGLAAGAVLAGTIAILCIRGP
jgi:sensitive to high expression protein 9, mitochondrial